MPPAVQRYEITQILAECQAKGLPLQMACIAALHWFEMNRIQPPGSILDWLAEVPRDIQG